MGVGKTRRSFHTGAGAGGNPCEEASLDGETANRMSRYELTAQAKEDVLTIWEYIVRDSLQATDRVETAIYEACNFVV
jgi:hypothetical protein